MIKLLIGGSPCTKWSIAQKKDREVTAEGEGWELFLNYAIAKEKFKPDFFLYENNKSAAQAIKDQISMVLGVPIMHINSALVSAQNRQRFYAFNWTVPQPIDRGILLKDILEGNGRPLNTTDEGKGYGLKGQYAKSSVKNFLSGDHFPQTGVAVPVDETTYALDAGSIVPPKNHTLHDCIRIGTIENSAKNKANDSKQYRVYSPNGKSTTLCGQGGGLGAKTGLYAIPITTTTDGKAQCLRATCYKDGIRNMICNNVDRRTCVAIPSKYAADLPIYKVKGGFIYIKNTPYPIELDDGYYAIRKLTVTECARLQTMPDDYCKAVSRSQAYKGLGNGWTAEVIIHILNGVLGKVDRHERIVALSMYDGIGTGRYCLDKMGFTNIEYYAYEIDPYAIKISSSNYPDIIQLGDAFDLRKEDWALPG